MACENWPRAGECPPRDVIDSYRTWIANSYWSARNELIVAGRLSFREADLIESQLASWGSRSTTELIHLWHRVTMLLLSQGHGNSSTDISPRAA